MQALTKARKDGSEAMEVDVDSQSQHVFGNAKMEQQAMNVTRQFAQSQPLTFEDLMAPSSPHHSMSKNQMQMASQHSYNAQDYSGGGYAAWKKPVHTTAVEEAYNKLLQDFCQVQSDAEKYRSYTGEDIRSTVRQVQSAISTLPGDRNPSLKMLNQLHDNVTQARQFLMDRVNFIKSYTDEGFQYVGFGDSEILDRIIRYQPECEIYLFFFNFSQRNEHSEIWQFFRYLLAYKDSNTNSSFVLVRQFLHNVGTVLI